MTTPLSAPWIRGSASAAVGLLVLLTVAASGSAAQTEPFLSIVTNGDQDLFAPLESFTFLIGFVDSNGNGRIDADRPDEPVYLDMDRTRSATFGDIRLASFLGYPAASVVDVSNHDYGLGLLDVSGWFATSDSGSWYLDADNTATVSIGDIEFTGAGGAVKVGASAANLGASLSRAQSTVSAGLRVGLTDPNGDSRWSHDEPVYLDLDGGGAVSLGDVRVSASGLVLDDPVTRDELEALQRDLASLRASLGLPETANPEADAAPQSASTSQMPGWAVFLIVVDTLAVLVLASLLVLQRRELAARPKKP